MSETSEIGHTVKERPVLERQRQPYHVVDRPTLLSGLGPLLGKPLGDGTGRLISHGDHVDVLLLCQDNRADNGPWIAQDGLWERPPSTRECEERVPRRPSRLLEAGSSPYSLEPYYVSSPPGRCRGIS